MRYDIERGGRHNMARMVMCKKLHRELPGLDRPPIPGELGKRIYQGISAEAWELWQEQSRLLINHYGLNLADPDARQLMRKQMEEYLFGDEEDEKPEGWTPEGQSGAKGKGAPAAPAAPARKK
jgi:Fe-S cluster biosynthesis and repair protein YggX